MKLQYLVGFGALVTAAAIAKQWPDIVRYLKMKQM